MSEHDPAGYFIFRLRRDGKRLVIQEIDRRDGDHLIQATLGSIEDHPTVELSFDNEIVYSGPIDETASIRSFSEPNTADEAPHRYGSVESHSVTFRVSVDTLSRTSSPSELTVSLLRSPRAQARALNGPISGGNVLARTRPLRVGSYPVLDRGIRQ
jgi:hypothetical protein